MKLVTMETNREGGGEETIGAVLPGERTLDLAPAAGLPPDMILFLEEGPDGMARARKAAAEAEAGEHSAHVRPLAEVRLKAPVPRPRKFIHSGRNFYKHLDESGSAKPRQIPLAPRFVSTLIGPDEPVVYPKITSQLDSEAEIVMVIGTRCKDVPRERAFEVIAGYTLYNDITARDIQVDEERGGLFLCKNLDTTNTLGPWIVTSDEIEDPQSLDIIGRVDGVELQRQSLSAMIFDIPHIISHLSQMTLEPGDLVSTGTPEGCGIFRKPDPTPYLLKVGSVAEVESGPIGILRNPIVEG